MKHLMQLTIILLLLSIASNKADSRRKAIMISYSWYDGTKLAMKLDNRLSSLGFKVWFDRKKLMGDIYQTMSVAVKSCDAFLMLMSPGYFNSSNCKREAEYAADLKKKIVPIVVTSRYNATGWLGILKAGLKYYDFSERKQFNKMFEKLLVELA